MTNVFDLNLDLDPFFNSSSYTYSEPAFEHGDADPLSCEHEWWKYNGVTYTTDPPQIKYQCKLCGKIEYRYVKHNPIPLWTKVEE